VPFHEAQDLFEALTQINQKRNNLAVTRASQPH
jgi:hypothetical protein